MRVRIVVLALCVGLAVAAAVSPAYADAKKARAAFDRGNKLYNLGRFDEALKAFEEAYLEKEDPVFLFNIGQCHRQAYRTAEALRAYRSYLRVAPDAANRTEVERRIAELEAQGRAAPATSPPASGRASPPPLPGPPSVAPGSTGAIDLAVTRAPAEPRPFYTRFWFWGSVAVVAAGAVVAGVFLANRSSDPTCPGTVKQCF